MCACTYTRAQHEGSLLHQSLSSILFGSGSLVGQAMRMNLWDSGVFGPGIPDANYHIQLDVGFRNLNSGPHTEAASVLLTKTSPQPLNCKF